MNINIEGDGLVSRTIIIEDMSSKLNERKMVERLFLEETNSPKTVMDRQIIEEYLNTCAPKK